MFFERSSQIPVVGSFIRVDTDLDGLGHLDLGWARGRDDDGRLFVNLRLDSDEAIDLHSLTGGETGILRELNLKGLVKVHGLSGELLKGGEHLVLEGDGSLSSALGGVEADGHATNNLFAVSLGSGMHLSIGLTFSMAVTFSIGVDLGEREIRVVLG